MKKILIFMLFAAGTLLFGYQARIDIYGYRGNLTVTEKSPGTRHSAAKWAIGKFGGVSDAVSIQQPTSSSRWTPMVFQVCSDQDDQLRIELKGEWIRLGTKGSKIAPLGVFYDELKINGRPFANGGFEPDQQKKHRWNRIVSDPGLAAEGNGVLRVWHNRAEPFRLPVKANIPVTVEILHREAGNLIPGADVVCLSFDKVANRTFGDETAKDGKGGWTDQGAQSLRDFAPQVSYGGIDFAIPQKGNAIVTMNSKFDPTGVKGFSLHPPQNSGEHLYLYFLHTGAWIKGKQQPTGTVTLVYEDGTTQEENITAGIHLGDWWNMPDVPEGKRVYLNDRNMRRGGFYLSRIRLARKPLREVRFTTAENNIWIVIAASLTSRDVPMTNAEETFRFDAPRWKTADITGTDIVAGSALDLSKSLPAYKFSDGEVEINPEGFLQQKNQPGKPIRFYASQRLPNYIWKLDRTEEEIRKQIDHCVEQYAMHGFNFYRSHNEMDSYGFFKGKAPQEFNPRQIDRMDYLFASLSKHNIPVWGNLTAYVLGFNEGWNSKKMFPFGAKDIADIKALVWHGHPGAREMWKKTVLKILNHVNPYTGFAYKDDPVFAVFEPFNEQMGCNLLFLNRRLAPAADRFIRQEFRKFLLKKYGSEEKFRAVWKCGEKEFGKLDFSSGTMRADFEEYNTAKGKECMRYYTEVIRSTNCTKPISQFNWGKTINDSRVRAETVDFICTNTYFCHPQEFMKKGSICPQISSLDSNDHVAYFTNAVPGIRQAGRPIGITEYAHCYWNRFGFEGGLLFGAYGAMQGIDAMMVFAAPVTNWNKLYRLDNFTISGNPSMRANVFLTNMLYRRGDVTESKKPIELVIPNTCSWYDGRSTTSPEQTSLALLTRFSLRPPELTTRTSPLWSFPIEGSAEVDGTNIMATGLKTSGKKSTFDLPGAVEILRGKGILPAGNRTDVKNGIYHSETGEILLDQKLRRLSVITPRTEAVTMREYDSAKLHCFTIDEVTANCCAAITSLDSLPIENSAHLMLILNTDNIAHNLKVSENRLVMIHQGDAVKSPLGVMNMAAKPPLSETVSFTGKVKNQPGRKFVLYPLNLSGIRRDPLPVINRDGELLLKVDTATLPHGPTPFFELVEVNNAK